MIKTLVLKPRLSEKAYALSEQRNTYVFDVPAGVNKQAIGQAVTSQYQVEVSSVRIAGVPGKVLRSYRRGSRRSYSGQRSAIRKAYVTLKEGNELPIFAAVKEASEKTTEKEKS